MDTLSHGLYGGLAFGRSSKREYFTAFFFGVMPDLLSFGILFVLSFLRGAAPDISNIPAYVYTMYDITHSLIVVAMIIGIVWLIHGKLLYVLFAWPLHILVDIPTHSAEFFPTPFLWPVSDFHIDGVSWGVPYIFFTNVAFLLVLYAWFFISRKVTFKKFKIW